MGFFGRYKNMDKMHKNRRRNGKKYNNEHKNERIRCCNLGFFRLYLGQTKNRTTQKEEQ